MKRNIISMFDGTEYEWLSNFYPCLVENDGVLYTTTEHAYQAAKTLIPAQRVAIQAAVTPGEAKRLGQRVTLRLDWEEIKQGVMYTLLKKKFGPSHPLLRAKLIATGDAHLIEGNWWNDTYWGVCDGVGTNHLGRLLMRVRDEINRREA
jgi:ribA/ribD-fused uncharacterized protein